MIWDALFIRPDGQERRRPLLVVYDEAHNLSDQQTSLLLGLESPSPLAVDGHFTGPTSFPGGGNGPASNRRGIHLRRSQYADLSKGEVASSGLVKEQVIYWAPTAKWKTSLPRWSTNSPPTDRRSDRWTRRLESGVRLSHEYHRGRATDGATTRNAPSRSGRLRQSSSGVIWSRGSALTLGRSLRTATSRLTKVTHSRPSSLCTKVARRTTPHLSPATTRTLSSTRVWRRAGTTPSSTSPTSTRRWARRSRPNRSLAGSCVGPGRRHYHSDRLNAAQLFIRVESNKVFDDVVNQTQQRLQGDNVPVIVTRTGPGTKNRRSLPAMHTMTVPDVATHTEDALDMMESIVASVPDYQSSAESTTGIGKRTKVQKIVGSKEKAVFEWEEVGTSSRVAARWLFSRSLRRFHRDAAAIITLDQPKWDASSELVVRPQLALQHYAEQVGSAFTTNSYIEVADEDDEDFVVGEALVRDEDFHFYEHAVHQGYSGLNATLELPFADALDKTGFRWARNPSRSGYGIPLVSQGGNDTFYPDFLAWAHGDVYAIDTKGSHIKADAMQKLVRIRVNTGTTPAARAIRRARPSRCLWSTCRGGRVHRHRIPARWCCLLHTGGRSRRRY